MKKIIWSLLFICNAAFAQIVTVPIPGVPGLSVTVGTGINALPLQNIQNNPNAVNITTWDDSYTNVPLGFNFPFFGQTFNNSWAATNGFVTFQDPAVSGLWGGCCSGVNLSATTDPRYNYTIFGLHTDLYSWNGANQYYLRGNNEMTYGWYNISQCCGSQGGNSFEIKINSSGLVDTRIAGGLVSWNSVTSGMSGDLTQGQYYQYYHGQGINILPGSASIFSWQALDGTGSLCVTNPLSSPSCPGYTEAQCNLNPLYSQTCAGYAQAYFNQQCSINSLYNSSCPGYASAYLTQQCNLDGLYSTSCPNYAEAYAKKYLLNVDTTGTNTTSTNMPSKNEATTTISNDGKVKTEVSKTGDSNVDSVIETKATSASPSDATATVRLTPSPSSGGQSVSAQTNTKTETKTETKAASSSNQQETTKTARTERNEQKSGTNESKSNSEMKQAAQQKAKEEMKKAEGAKTFEAQIATQAAAVNAIAFVPGFDAYQTAKIIDVNALQLQRQYGKDVVDNRQLGRGLFGPSDTRHQEMVNQQYQLGN